MQVCQETSPELFDEGAAGPSDDPEICAPVIHATITTSPPDNDLLGAVPFSLNTESSLFLSQEPLLETSYEESLCDVQSTCFSPKQCLVSEAVDEATPEFVGKIGPAPEPMGKIGPAPEPLVEIGPASAQVPEISLSPEHMVEIGSVLEPLVEIGPALEPVVEIRTASEPVAEISPSSYPESSFSDHTADVSLIPDDSHTSAVPVLVCHTGVNSHPESSSLSLSLGINFSSAAESAYPETTASSILEEKELVTDGEKYKSTYVMRETGTVTV